MGVKVKKRNGAWWVFINYHGRRKAKKVGTREAAERVKRELEARRPWVMSAASLSQSRSQP